MIQIQKIMQKIVNHNTLTETEAFFLLEGIVNKEISDVQAASVLSIMSHRGETAEEIVGFVKMIRKMSNRSNQRFSHDIMDTCGTGGDGASTFNISTAVSIILSSLGIKVAKHGNKAVTSKSGSSDVLESLCVKVAKNHHEAESQLIKNDIAFLHAPYFHPALKEVAHLRQQLPFRTIFNIIGPLCNPLSPSYQLIGVSNEKTAATMATAINMLGIKKALVVTGNDGLDECSITDETKMYLVENGTITSFSYTPEEAGLQRGNLNEITVKNKQESAELILSIFKNKSNDSAKNIVILNAAAALFASNRVPTIRDGVEIVQNCLRSGVAYHHLLFISKEEEKALVN
ncbi:anthranilate phosphoribosyltransferase [Fictibacillus nanhaiensis]|uniref:anthranilate phosphoribosyltransferase n=1 Tax=Fictibacillus nanhaiensis TaxID=742169 RepID=UPI001C93E1F3|nr:anthranilate phosphoribosyltransferase [Fictibacillus nanhaiensis]MBY6035696.1 anthranilate phosphoribosyltransferase [Fictibacillus nanhaiensis]